LLAASLAAALGLLLDAILLVDLFFFFQAEDGIRDDLVTGVQTCALPISDPHGALAKPQMDCVAVRVREDLGLNVARLRDQFFDRSEERRVGKECRLRGWAWR